jgi:hypothetical protein
MVEASIMGITAYLCKLTQPFTLYIGPGVVADQLVADLADSVSAWQLQNVSVKRKFPADECDFSCPDVLEHDQEFMQQETGSEGDDDDEDDENDDDDDDEEEEEEEEGRPRWGVGGS